MSMSEAEAKLRVAQEDWAEAMKDWVQAQENIRMAKSAWTEAQAEFFHRVPMCSEGCSGCPKGGL